MSLEHPAKFLSETQEHFTPPHIVEAARSTLGRIELDPASCVEANRFVQADRWIGLPDDGLAVEWSGRVFLNPPGGTFTPKRKQKTDPKPTITPADKAHKSHYGTDSRATAWWFKLIEEFVAGRVSAAVFVGFNIEILRTGQHRRPSPLSFPICVPEERLCFGGDQPSHANVIVGVGVEPVPFFDAFKDIGEVCVPAPLVVTAREQLSLLGGAA